MKQFFTFVFTLTLIFSAHAQSVKGSRVRKASPPAAPVKPVETKPVEMQSGVISMNRLWISTLLKVEGEKIVIDMNKLRAMQARESGNLKGMCPAGQEFQNADVDFKVSNATIADAHLSAFSSVIGTRWSVVTLPEFGKTYNPLYIKLSRTIDDVRQQKNFGENGLAQLKVAQAQQAALVEETHQVSQAHLRTLIEKIQKNDPPKKLGQMKLPFPIRYSCQVKHLGHTTDAGAPETDAVQ